MNQEAKTISDRRGRPSAFSRFDRIANKNVSSPPGGDKAKASQNSAPKQQAVNKPNAPRASREIDVANGLLNLEREARKAQSEAELGYLIVNGSRVAVQYRQAMLLMRAGPKNHRVAAVSSLSAVDRNSTFVRWIEGLAKSKLAGENCAKVISFDARQDARENDLDAKSYPFHQVAFIPMQLRDGTVFAHVLFTRETPWDEKSLVACARICETYSHAWEALSGPSKARKRLRSKTLSGLLLTGCVIAAGFYPVPLTVLAPAEITAANPFVMAAPIDGVIDSVAVEPNTFVKKGALLFSYSDTDLRNRVKLAGQAVGVAEARFTQSMRTSFADSRAKRELAIAKSELQLKAGEYDYAKELLKKSVVRAPRAGLIIFADKDTWTGRPVSTGERIMRIANPKNVDVTINLPVSDAIVLEKGAKVQLYLDSAPLNPVEAVLSSASFHARPDASGVLSYRVTARFENPSSLPRIGLRGTAQVHGEEVKLAYFLFRKPLSVIRQWTGM